MSHSIEPGAGIPVEEREGSLPRRDWILLPLIGLTTIGILVLACSCLAKHLFPQSSPPGYASIYDCIKGTDDPYHMHGNRNAACRGNARDEPVVEYQLNGQGHRAGVELLPKQSNTYRIVMIGSSVALGEGVVMDQTVAALLPRELSRATGRHIELYNESMIDQLPDSIASHFSLILPANPDLILWIVTAHDLSEKMDSEPNQNTVGATGRVSSIAARSGLLNKALRRVKEDLGSESISQALSDLWHRATGRYKTGPTMIMFQYFLFKSQSQYIRSYLMGTKEGGYLSAKMDSEWQADLRHFDHDYARIETQARTAGIPLVTVLVPDRAQTALVSMGTWPAGYDPYNFDDALHSIVVDDGGTYLDILPGFRTIPNPELYYFQVSNHPNAQGDEILSKLLAKELTNGAIPSLKVLTAQPQFAGGLTF